VSGRPCRRARPRRSRQNIMETRRSAAERDSCGAEADADALAERTTDAEGCGSSSTRLDRKQRKRHSIVFAQAEIPMTNLATLKGFRGIAWIGSRRDRAR